MILTYGLSNSNGETTVHIKDNIKGVEEIEGGNSLIFHHYNEDKTQAYFGNIFDNKKIIFMNLMNDDLKTIKVYKGELL